MILVARVCSECGRTDNECMREYERIICTREYGGVMQSGIKCSVMDVEWRKKKKKKKEEKN